MEIQDLGAIGEFVSSLVVVVTLIVLTWETRKAKQATLQANRVVRQQIRNDLSLALIQTDDLATSILSAAAHLQGEGSEGVVEGLAAEFNVAPGTLGQIFNWYLALLRHLEDQFFTELPDPDREALIRQIRYTVGNALGVRFWQILKDQFHPSFQDFIEQHLSTAPFPATA